MKTMSQILRCFFKKQRELRERSVLALAISESKTKFYYDDIDGVPYICDHNVPLYRISNEPTDLVKGIVNIQDTCKVITNHRNAYIKSVV